MNKTEICKFKTKDNINWYNFYLGSMSKYFAKDKPSEISLNVTLNVSLSNPKCTS